MSISCLSPSIGNKHHDPLPGIFIISSIYNLLVILGTKFSMIKFQVSFNLTLISWNTELIFNTVI